MKKLSEHMERFGKRTAFLLRAALISIVISGICLILYFYTDDGKAGMSYSESRFLLNTYCTITVYGNDTVSEHDLPALADDVFLMCAELENLLSVTVQGSDVWRINNASGQTVAVNDITVEVINAALGFSEISDGMFDITIGRLSSLWDFGGGAGSVPSEADIISACSSVDYRQVYVTDGGIRLGNPDTRLDLGGIAKGYIADKAYEYLLKAGVESALINFGGDIRAAGTKPGGSSWRLGVRQPFGEMNEYAGILTIADTAVAGSGTYERQFEVDGARYHHILNPLTGMPAASNVIGATVVADNTVIAEGLSTIAILAGSKRSAELFPGVPGFIGAVLVLEDYEIVIIGEVEFEKS